MGMVEEEVLKTISLAERVNSAIAENKWFKTECGKAGILIGRIKKMLEDLLLLESVAALPLYNRPIVKTIAEVSKNLGRVLTLIRKCNPPTSLFVRFTNVNREAVFQEILRLLESSTAKMGWLLCLFHPTTGCAAAEHGVTIIRDPVIQQIWTLIATIQMGKLMKDRINAAENLASLAQANEGNKKIIEEEGGIHQILNLLKSNSEAQITATNALFILSDHQERVRAIVYGNGIPAIVHILDDSPFRVQILAADLVARMAEIDPTAQEVFAKENAIVFLMKLLSFEIFAKQSNYSVLETKTKHNDPISVYLLNRYFEVGEIQRKKWEMEKPEEKLRLKMNCSKALWKLARGNVSNSKNIAGWKGNGNGLLCLAKIMEERENDELHLNCLMTVMEIAAAVGCDAHSRHSVFKTNSPGVKAVIDQLLIVIKESDELKLQIPAIRSIGSLAWMFPARETRVIECLVAELRSKQQEVAEEAVMALQKFVCPNNFLRSVHSKSIMELKGLTVLAALIEKGSKEAEVLIRHVFDATKPAARL